MFPTTSGSSELKDNNLPVVRKGTASAVPNQPTLKGASAPEVTSCGHSHRQVCLLQAHLAKSLKSKAEALVGLLEA